MKASRNCLLALALASVAAACGNQQEAGPISGYMVQTYRDAGVAQEGDVITVTRAGDGAQGVTFAAAPIRMDFTVEGEAAQLQARRSGQWIDVPLAESNSIMLGPGGATHMRVVSRTADSLVIRVTGVTDCSTAPEGACVPVVAPAAAPETDAATDAEVELRE